MARALRVTGYAFIAVALVAIGMIFALLVHSHSGSGTELSVRLISWGGILALSGLLLAFSGRLMR